MRTTLLALSLSLLMPAALLAQTSETGTDEPEPTTQTPSIEDQLSLGEDANDAPTVGQTYVDETFGAWQMRCVVTEDGNDPCQMYQLMSDEQGTPVAEISIFRLPEGGRASAGATIIVPLETSLPQQLTVKVDDNTARRYPFAFCNQIGCFSRVGLVPDEVDAFKRGNEAILSIVPALAPDQTVELVMSLDGFTAAFDNTSVADN
ncbi:invasion associated locus B family protein [Tateyamaria pelophila]|uniref:invasion associated locus B family protein n=1 Tax=Tateyamaria pelophila TaxID=328415 RepID=UPI001CBCBCD3|nr:invasion associated locus B family protein [Tateyamaria pelophila]